MLNWIKQKVRSWAHEIDVMPATLKIGTVSDSSEIINADKSLRFVVYRANGGTVIETVYRDRNKERYTNGLYVVTDDKDLGHEIGKIITMESMRGI